MSLAYNLVLLSSSAIFFGCATVISPPTNTVGLSTAIKSNDIEAVKSILAGKSFSGKAMTILDDHNNLRHLDELRAYDFLELATKECKPEIVKTLINANLPPRDKDLAAAISNGCADSSSIIAQFLSPADREAGTEAGLKDVKEKLSYRGGYDFSQIEGLKETLNRIAPFSKTNSATECLTIISERIEKPVQNAQLMKNAIEAKFGMPMCEEPLYNVIYNPQGGPVRDGCIYLLSGPLKVLQVVPGGILVNLVSPNPYFGDKVLYVKTASSFADSDHLPKILLKSAGTFSYKNALGTLNTVRSFQHLDFDLQTH